MNGLTRFTLIELLALQRLISNIWTNSFQPRARVVVQSRNKTPTPTNSWFKKSIFLPFPSQSAKTLRKI